MRERFYTDDLMLAAAAAGNEFSTARDSDADG